MVRYEKSKGAVLEPPLYHELKMLVRKTQERSFHQGVSGVGAEVFSVLADPKPNRIHNDVGSPNPYPLRDLIAVDLQNGEGRRRRTCSLRPVAQSGAVHVASRAPWPLTRRLAKSMGLLRCRAGAFLPRRGARGAVFGPKRPTTGHFQAEQVEGKKALADTATSTKRILSSSLHCASYAYGVRF